MNILIDNMSDKMLSKGEKLRNNNALAHNIFMMIQNGFIWQAKEVYEGNNYTDYRIANCGNVQCGISIEASEEGVNISTSWLNKSEEVFFKNMSNVKTRIYNSNGCGDKLAVTVYIEKLDNDNAKLIVKILELLNFYPK